MSILSLTLKDSIYNVGYNLSLLPYQAELSIRSNIYAAKKINEEKKAKKQEKREEAKIFDEAHDLFGGEMSKQKSDDIANEANGNNIAKLKLVGKAIETDKWLQFALYYMTNENAILVKATDSEKELVNGIAKYFNFGKIYDSAEVADLEVFDISCKEKYVSSSNYIISIKGDIETRLKDDLIMSKIAKRKEQLAAESEHPEDDEPDLESVRKPSFVKDKDGIIHPVFFRKDEETVQEPIQGAGISDELFQKLEDNLIPFIGDTGHRYGMYGDDLVSLFITRENGIEEQYIIDPGICMGRDKMYVLGKVPNDTLFVSLEHENIVKNILNNNFYILDQTECQIVIQEYFRNMNLYRYIDMNNTGFLNKLSAEEFQKLGKKLTFIIGQLQNQKTEEQDFPRFRFNSWKSVDDFMIISDVHVKSPLSMTGETSTVIVEGLMFIVEGDNITQKLKDYTTQFHIDKYGEM